MKHGQSLAFLIGMRLTLLIAAVGMAVLAIVLNSEVSPILLWSSAAIFMTWLALYIRTRHVFRNLRNSEVENQRTDDT